MFAFRFFALLGLAGCFVLPAGAEEHNAWPIRVEQTSRDPSGREQASAWQAAGPLFFGKTGTDGRTAGGFRPFYVYWNNPADHTAEEDYLYPILTHRVGEGSSRWSLLELINASGPDDSRTPGVRQFDIWPFYFSRETGHPATSYHAVFPLHGTVLDRFGDDRISWTLFPLYGSFERNGVTTVTMPWPFVKLVSGKGNQGVALWPLFGWREKPGVYRDQFYLWPLIYRNESRLSAPKPTVNLGVLPFYTREQSADAISETYLWPFFGYTNRWAPYHYRETRWFWPLLVQGRGDDRRVNRWAPVYTHSTIKGDDKRWILWPLFRQERWTESGLRQTKTQLLYFVYWSLRERSAANPKLAPAEKIHLWPLYSYWDNGAGRRQLQVLSPLAVFFTDNPSIRLGYSPLFALYRYDQRAPGNVRWSLLWDAVTWRRTPTRREFHLGPLFSYSRGPHGRRIAFGRGLFGWRRDPRRHAWHPFLFDFSSKPHKESPPTATP